MHNLPRSPATRAYEGVGLTPQDWCVMEAIPGGGCLLVGGKPARNPVTVNRRFMKRRRAYELDGCIIEPDGKDAFKAYKRGALVAECVIVGVPRTGDVGD